MLFSQQSKLAVLESKLGMYEELSREMLSKLETAVEKISEGNSHIAMILTKHDERIEQSMKSDELLVKMIDEMKNIFNKDQVQYENKIEKLNEKLDNRISSIDTKIADVTKFRWLVLGGLIIISFIFSQSSSVVDILTPDSNEVRIEKSK